MSEKITKLIPRTPLFQEKAGQKAERLGPFDTTKGKLEKPANVIDIESGRKRKQMKESVDTSSVLSDALELVRGGQLSDPEIDDLRPISENEKILLKVMSGLFERLRKYDEEVEELHNLIKKLKQEKDAGQKI